MAPAVKYFHLCLWRRCKFPAEEQKLLYFFTCRGFFDMTWAWLIWDESSIDYLAIKQSLSQSQRSHLSQCCLGHCSDSAALTSIISDISSFVEIRQQHVSLATAVIRHQIMIVKTEWIAMIYLLCSWLSRQNSTYPHLAHHPFVHYLVMF